MKRGVRWLIGAAIVWTLVFALVVEAWIRFILGGDEDLILTPFLVYAMLLLAVLALLALVAVKRFESYQARLRKFCVDLRQGARFARWRPSTVVSGILALICMALWVDGCCLRHHLLVPLRGSFWTGVEIYVDTGALNVVVAYDSKGAQHCAFAFGRHDNPSSDPWVPGRRRRGLAFRGGVVFGSEHFSVPHWLLILLFSLAPAWVLHRGYRQYRREAAKCCLKCGYNLTGNTSGVCPECGADVPPDGASDDTPPGDS